MSVLYVTEYQHVYNGVPVEPALTEQKITISGASAQSAAFNTLTTAVVLHVDGITAIKFGVNPTAAVASSPRMAAGDTRFMMASGGLKVAGITTT